MVHNFEKKKKFNTLSLDFKIFNIIIFFSKILNIFLFFPTNILYARILSFFFKECCLTKVPTGPLLCNFSNYTIQLRGRKLFKRLPTAPHEIIELHTSPISCKFYLLVTSTEHGFDGKLHVFLT